jgi:hypothetical protein
LVKLNQSYHHRKTARKRVFQQKAENRLGVGTR